MNVNRLESNTIDKRRYAIDWLRVRVMLAVFFFHCARFFGGATWHLNNAEQSFGALVFIGWNIGILPKDLTIATASFTLVMVLYTLFVRPFNGVRFLFGMRPQNPKPVV